MSKKKSNKRQQQLFKGDFVKSSYKAKWSGVILEITQRDQWEDLALVLVLEDSNGNIPRKRMVKTLSVYWLNKIKPIDISKINEDWFKKCEYFFK